MKKLLQNQNIGYIFCKMKIDSKQKTKLFKMTKFKIMTPKFSTARRFTVVVKYRPSAMDKQEIHHHKPEAIYRKNWLMCDCLQISNQPHAKKKNLRFAIRLLNFQIVAGNKFASYIINGICTLSRKMTPFTYLAENIIVL